VEDSGQGIDESEQGRLFQPYNQVEPEKRHFSGLGIGLALCKQFVNLHGGKIWVRSQKGRGSTFSFSLPIIPPAAGETVHVDIEEKQFPV
jgi:signal transduction histidine kinase